MYFDECAVGYLCSAESNSSEDTDFFGVRAAPKPPRSTPRRGPAIKEPKSEFDQVNILKKLLYRLGNAYFR